LSQGDTNIKRYHAVRVIEDSILLFTLGASLPMGVVGWLGLPDPLEGPSQAKMNFWVSVS